MSYPDEKEWQGFEPTEKDEEWAERAERFLATLPEAVTNYIVVEAKKIGLDMTGDDIMTFRNHLQDAVGDSFADGFERINNLLHKR